MTHIDLQTTMKNQLILKITTKQPDEIKILIPNDGYHTCHDTLRLEKPIHKVSSTSPWSTTLKAKINRAYQAMGETEAMAKIIIKEGYFDALMELQQQHHQKVEAAQQMESSLIEQAIQKRETRIRKESQEFTEYLHGHNATVMDFLEFISTWLLSGESKNIMTVFFAHFSTITGLRPIWTIFLGGPGEGKSAIEQASFSLIPARCKYGGRSSYAATLNQARDYGNDFLDRKIISLGDLGGKNSYIKWEETLDVYKELSSEGAYDYKKMEDSVNPDTKQKEVISIKVEGYPSVSFASTHSDGLTGQYLSRGITITPVGTDDDILNYRRYVRPATRAKAFRDELTGKVMSLFHSYIENLILDIETTEVINPYYLCLEDWFRGSSNVKRASEMFTLLVDAVTLFNYKSRHLLTTLDGDKYYLATKEDNEVIARLFDITPGLTAQVVAFYNKLVERVGKFQWDEFEEYKVGDKSIKECKTIFTVPTLRNIRFRRSSEDEKEQFSRFCHLLHDAGKLDSLMKNHKGHHVYCLTDGELMGTVNMKCDISKVKEYIEEDIAGNGWGMGLDYDEIVACIGDEKSHRSSWTDFKQPPWDNMDEPAGVRE